MMRVGTICYACSQGLGYLAKSFYDAGVVTDVMVFRHPHGDRPSKMEWYPKGTQELVNRPFNQGQIKYWLETNKIDVMLFFETPFDWNILRVCNHMGVRTAILAMYEWYLREPPWKPDIILAPSLLDKDYFPGGVFLPVPVAQGTWKQRTKALRFLHNAGHIGSRNHKGTVELMRAMEFVKSPLTLTIRSQNVAGLSRLTATVPKILQDRRVSIEPGEVPYESLFDGYDVLVAPEKYNGLSLPLQEARAAGMLVMASDRYPTNTWLPTCDVSLRDTLIPVDRYDRAVTCRGHLEFDEAVIDPKAIAETMDSWYGQDIRDYSMGSKTWAAGQSWEVLKSKYLAALGG